MQFLLSETKIRPKSLYVMNRRDEMPLEIIGVHRQTQDKWQTLCQLQFYLFLYSYWRSTFQSHNLDRDMALYKCVCLQAQIDLWNSDKLPVHIKSCMQNCFTTWNQKPTDAQQTGKRYTKKCINVYKSMYLPESSTIRMWYLQCQCIYLIHALSEESDH